MEPDTLALVLERLAPVFLKATVIEAAAGCVLFHRGPPSPFNGEEARAVPREDGAASRRRRGMVARPGGDFRVGREPAAALVLRVARRA